MKHQLPIMAVVLLVILPLSASLYGSGKIKATTVLKTGQLIPGQTIEVSVVIDLSDLPERLGSFTTKLSWNAEALKFEGCTGGTTPGFEQPVLNSTEAKAGKLIVANAQPYGAEGSVNVLNVKFKVLRAVGSDTRLTLSFSALAAAKTFTDLLPYLNQITAVEDSRGASEVPGNYELWPNYPNPFNPITEIRYQLPVAGFVHLAVYNIMGYEVRTLVNRKMPAGSHAVQWDGKDDKAQIVPSGFYILRMKSGNFISERKMIFAK